MKLTLIRHGQSEWNKLNLFTGWQDVDLSEEGVQEAIEAGKLLKAADIPFEVAYSSVLTRANKTLYHVLNQTDRAWVPIYKSWRLNERHYGALTGLNKAETAAKYGDEQVHIWRRSYNVSPPEMDAAQALAFKEDPRYADLPNSEFPLTENLEITLERVRPYWIDNIARDLSYGKNVLVVAHGNSLRALSKMLDNISDEDITSLEIATGQPIVYDLDEDLNVVNKTILTAE
ncbi:2,3-diphosphoglycerate-dependent phosphoglycerate mutase [Suicoccus acidiformans]|uniref:2,3-bisphosphoglycerate-dependent phosphoglycerate mutase n=1 Tax=Suicoccus acidiformans TaxID=2036206 RepID=A0A347WN16_9LACT|nr:2,3-diphosphoglycerate-dependent phosphoglycerate mutase [Suicoccus acidiformans]AXY26473.1 2,3-diphosphoglycerate-dependent phosphoglycerate mutase [Suicoccus acidiformans]